MGNSSVRAQRSEAALALEPPGQRHGGKVQRPDPIVDFLKSDAFPAQRFAEKGGDAAPADAAVSADASDLPVTGILEGWEMPGERARRGTIARRGHGVAQSLVRTLLVVFAEERVEALLLAPQRARRRPRRLGFQVAMKPFVRPVLIGAPGRNAFDANAQPHPPDVQARQLREPRARERGAIVGPNAPRQSAGGKRLRKAVLRRPAVF